MKKKLGLLASSLIVLATQSSAAIGQGFVLDGLGCDLCPYIGADVAWRHMNFVTNNGGGLVRKNYPQGNVYLGVKFNEYIGLEGGFESTTTKRRTTTFPSNQPIFFGLSDTVSAPTTVVTSTRMYGWHLNLVGFYPIYDEYCLSVVGSAGVARQRLKLKTYPTLIAGGEFTPTVEDTRTFSSSKYVARLGLGLQQMFSECSGIRAMVGWENTHRFKNLASKQFSRAHATVKDSTWLSLGVFYNF